MASRVVIQKKKTGRPSKGVGSVTAIRLSEELRAAVDKWAVKQEGKPSRSEAIRRLLEMALKN
jgi:metal-responsive CopG/Arc/MetJ family transcriptional regulator